MSIFNTPFMSNMTLPSDMTNQQIHALTPSDHSDYENLVTVQKDMLLVAEEINEIKKRKDIVEKIVGSKKKNDSDVRQEIDV